MSTISNEDVQTSKPQSSLEARREARIRKILENSKSRLEKLNGEATLSAPAEYKGINLFMTRHFLQIFVLQRRLYIQILR